MCLNQFDSQAPQAHEAWSTVTSAVSEVLHPGQYFLRVLELYVSNNVLCTHVWFGFGVEWLRCGFHKFSMTYGSHDQQFEYVTSPNLTLRSIWGQCSSAAMGRGDSFICVSWAEALSLSPTCARGDQDLHFMES